jgi:hypothetical protein
MDLRELLDANDEEMRHLKEEWVASKPENVELSIYIHFWRGDLQVASVQTPLDGDVAVRVAFTSAAGFNAEVMALTFESWVTELKESPLTGKAWRPGEMNFIARTDPQAAEKGWVSEQMATSIHDRAGNFLLSKQRFTVKDGTVIWGERTVTDMSVEEKDHPLQEAMTQQTMLERIIEMADEDVVTGVALNAITDTETRLFHCDMATLFALEEKGLATAVMLFAEEGTPRQQMIAERADEIGLSTDK